MSSTRRRAALDRAPPRRAVAKGAHTRSRSSTCSTAPVAQPAGPADRDDHRLLDRQPAVHAGELDLPLVQQTAVVAALALGQTLVILTAGIDLSCGAICVLSMMIMASLSAKNGPRTSGPGHRGRRRPAGRVHQRALVTRLNLPPFIVTLGTLSIFTAIALLYSGAESIQDNRLPDILNWTGESFSIAGFRITNGVLLVVVMYAIVGFALSQTAWGRHLYAVGDDSESARPAASRASGCCCPSTPSPA